MNIVNKIIDGKAIASRIISDLKKEADKVRDILNRPPSLAVLLVGGHPASLSYVKSKERACKRAGITTEIVRMSESATQAEVVSKVLELGFNKETDAILVQLPLPSHIDQKAVIDTLPPLKDVDGLHSENAGLLLQGNPRFVPATPLGLLRVLQESNITVSGANVVIVGRSHLVGMPLVPLLAARGIDATVTISHTKTKNLTSYTKAADILIVAAGKPAIINGSMVKLGATVLDVGINRISDPKTQRGYRIVGDVEFKEVSKVAHAVTPVPGGVGPMTVAMLVHNVILASKLRTKSDITPILNVYNLVELL